MTLDKVPDLPANEIVQPLLEPQIGERIHVVFLEVSPGVFNPLPLYMNNAITREIQKYVNQRATQRKNLEPPSCGLCG